MCGIVKINEGKHHQVRTLGEENETRNERKEKIRSEDEGEL